MTHEEALHGLTAPRGTNFPIPIALASTWDPALLERVMSVAALEARARGTHHVLSPVLDLARDPRWGRTEETYGEDPYLVSRLGVAAIRGYQGASQTLAKDKVFATAKHFAAHGPHEGGINTAPGNFSERDAARPVPRALRGGGGGGGGDDRHALLQRDRRPALPQEPLAAGHGAAPEWGFGGLVVSDYYAIEQMQNRHARGRRTSRTRRARRSTVGVDIELPDPKAYATLVEQVACRPGRRGRRSTGRVARMLRAKFLAGLFEDPLRGPRAGRPRQQRARSTRPWPSRRRAARSCSSRTRAALLPLDRKKLKTIAVVGPNAKGVHLGGYSSDPGRGVGILQGIREKAGPGVQVLHAEGVRITEHDPDWYGRQGRLRRPREEPRAHHGGGGGRRGRPTSRWS